MKKWVLNGVKLNKKEPFTEFFGDIGIEWVFAKLPFRDILTDSAPLMSYVDLLRRNYEDNGLKRGYKAMKIRKILGKNIINSLFEISSSGLSNV